MNLTELKCDYRENPIGIDSKRPALSWRMESTEQNVVQTVYQVTVIKGGTTVWDSGKVQSDQSAGIIYAGEQLESMKQYTWTAAIWDNKGNEAAESAVFETALMHKTDWKAKWAEPVQNPAYKEEVHGITGLETKDVPLEDIKMEPAQMLRKEFTLSKKIKSARIYATAHGVYYLELNGTRVGDIQLAPGHTSYYAYLEYQTYEVTKQLRTGENAIGMVLGDGWYCGKVGITGQSCQYGNKLAGIFQIEVEYQDGTKETIISDADCTAATGPIDYADLYVGVRYDANKEQNGFSSPGFLEKDWKPVEVKDYGYDVLYAQFGDPVRVIETRKPEKVWITPKGEIMVDAGQVLAGHVIMRVQGEKGTQVILEHTETLDKEGNFLRNIIGSFVNQTDTYILKGGAQEVFHPEFTYHGFRYIKVEGYPGVPAADDFDIVVIGSDMEKTGKFTCSDIRLNQLQHNIFWSQRSNMISIPTDCPQREKAGWTADAQVIAPTASYNMDVNAFYKRWLRLMAKDQTKDGQIPNVVPYLEAYHMSLNGEEKAECSSGWGDAAVIVPYAMYLAYGDKTVLSDNYDMMRRWVAYIRDTAENELPEIDKKEMSPERKEWNKYLWNTNFHFGDWLTPSVSFNFETGDVDMIQSALRTMDIIPTTMYAYATELMAKISRILEKPEEEKYYSSLNEKVRESFIKEYVDEQGYISTELQGVYVLALQMNLVPNTVRRNTFAKLEEMIAENGGRLDTGFLSVPFLMDILTKEGSAKEAYDMLFQDECPSWLYEVKMGATTMWEAWQAILPDGTPTSVSYNHYAFGCVGDWMYRNIAGINSAEPGYKKIVIKPLMDSRITYAAGSYKCVYGRIRSEWKLDGGWMKMEVEIPCNTTAKVYLPKADGSYECKTVGSGKYRYEYSS